MSSSAGKSTFLPGWLARLGRAGPALVRQLLAARLRAPGRPRLYLIDPSYQNDYGHYRAVAERLGAECAARGWSFFHLTGPLDPAPPSARAPVFQYVARLPVHLREPGMERPLLRNLHLDTTRVLRRFARVLGGVLALDRALFPDGDAYFLFYTGEFLHPWALLDGGRLGRRQHFVVFQFLLPPRFAELAEQTRFRQHARLLARRLATAGDSAARVRVATDSPALQRWLAPTLGERLEILPPPFLSAADFAALPEAAALARRPHPCAYFGYLTGKHGWHHVLHLLQRQAGQATRWLVQLDYKNAEFADREKARAAIAAAGATLIEGHLDPVQFSAAMARCASVLLPYRARDYAYISSAKLILALGHGCFPIVPAGTWLDEIVREAGYGLAVAEREWPEVPRRLAALDLPALWAARRERVRELVSRYTPGALLDWLCQPPSQI
jgi:hypothetical protein